jgi:apolipoprotein N-acyltransferase
VNRLPAQLGVCASAALLWVLAAPPFGLWPLAWVAMAPTLWLWSRAPTAGRAGLLGWATGAGMTLGGFHWFAPMMQEHAHLPWPAAILTLLALAAYQGLALMLSARAVWWVRAWAAARGRPLPMALCAPVAIAATELVVPVIFPYQLAVTQTPALPVIQIADLAGAGAISALLVGFAGAVVDLVERGRAAWRGAAAIAGVVAATCGYGVWRLGDVEAARRAAPRIAVGLVQPNERMQLGVHDRDAEARLLAGMQAASAALERAGAQLVVWSESSYPQTLPRDLTTDLDEQHRWRIRRGFTVPAVIGAITAERGGRARRYNSALLLDGDRLVARHDKIHRVLGSEWNPVVEWFPSLAGTLPSGFAGGDRPVILPVRAGGLDLRLGPMICLEDTVPGYGRELADARPNLLVNQTIDTWFGTFAEPWQHRGLAVLRAVEIRADMVRAVNTGPSGLIEATGRIGPQSPVRAGARDVESILVEPRVMDAGHTVYATIGDAFGWLCVLVTLGAWIAARRAMRVRKPPRADRRRGRRR